MAKAENNNIDIELPAASAIALGATSYDFNKLHDGALHASGLKTQDGRNNALVKAERDARLAEMPGEAQAVPPGTTIEKVEDANGTVVAAPVNDPDKQPADPATPPTTTDAN